VSDVKRRGPIEGNAADDALMVDQDATLLLDRSPFILFSRNLLKCDWNKGYILMITVGIDVGSNTTKAALLKDGAIAGTLLIPTGYNAKNAGEKVFHDLLAEHQVGRDTIDRVIATGYGRNSIDFADKAITEITCHAAGAHYQDPEVRTVIDIGGQDSKAIALDRSGRVTDFAMNDKCAAGTGRFLEVMARALEVDLDVFGEMSLKADAPAAISSLCTVFAESEVISLISRGEKRKNIIAGIHDAIGARVAAMANRIDLVDPISMTGGVARNVGVVKALRKNTGRGIKVLKFAQINGAIGAALIAAR
jgi:(R)-2-hydroxyacyl-CoA dehydratese activating ATPase